MRRDKVGWDHPFQGDYYPWRIGRVCAGDKLYPDDKSYTATKASPTIYDDLID
jgi:hypothetical protein